MRFDTKLAATTKNEGGWYLPPGSSVHIAVSFKTPQENERMLCKLAT